MPDAHTIIDVHVMLVRDRSVLLTRADSGWNLPAAVLAAGGSLPAGAAATARAEVGVTVHQDDLTHVATVHVADPGAAPRLGVFFTTDRWQGTPTCAEPAWHPLDGLPADVVPYPLAGLTAYREGTTFCTFGRKRSLPALV